MEEIVFTIKDGKIEMEVAGVRGTRCLELTRAIEQMLGMVESRFLKQDYYRPAEIRPTVDIGHAFFSLPKGKD